MIRQGILILTLGFSLAGCANLDRALDPLGAVRAASHEAGAAAGRKVGEAVGDAIVRHYSPAFMNWYTGYLTRMAFNAHGYSVESATRGYEPGEYTEWAIRSDDEETPTNRMQRALLREESNGNQWWQVIYHDNASDDTIVMEALFTPDREQMLRMRALFPDDDSPREIPVDEQNYQAPIRLTQESIAGATEGEERIRVPAGRFDTTRIRFGGGGLDQLWWLSDEVPGGIVRHAMATTEEETPDQAEQMPTENYIMELQEFGKDAKSQLGI